MSSGPTIKSPYPYFGGKSSVADVIWERFGDVDNYVEPFFGSGATLLRRPHPPKTETVNDINAWLTNFWRAVQRDPDAVAFHADWPVSELDLHARGDWLFYRREAKEWVERVRNDADFFDAKSAGWWCWGMCCWIGSGWGPKEHREQVWRSRPGMGTAGQGVNRQRPRLGGWSDTGVNADGIAADIYAYMADLSERTRRVRVCCGNWDRVCGPSVTHKHGVTAILQDPPYGAEDRHECYEDNSYTVAGDVREWCKTEGTNPLMRIALCGYAGEGHEELESLGWDVFEWKSKGGFQSQRKNGTNDNAKRERIWFSPHCLKPDKFRGLSDLVEDNELSQEPK